MWHSARWIVASVIAASALAVATYLESNSNQQFVQNNGGPNFETALAFAIAVASVVTFVAARVYLRRKPPFRFGPLGTAIMLTPVWLFVGFAIFDRIYWGY